MTDVVNDYFKQFYPDNLDEAKFSFSTMLGGMRRYEDYAVSNIFPPMVCADGFSVSVQGHAGAYSSPRDDFADRYSAVECGFPSDKEDLLMKYAEDDDKPTETVYGFVPVETVIAVIEKHGGLKL